MLFGSDYPLITPERWMKDFEEAGFKDRGQARHPEGQRDAVVWGWARAPEAACSVARGPGLPAPVHPPPLLGAAHDQQLQRAVELARGQADGLVGVGVFDGRERRLETQHMVAVGCRANSRPAPPARRWPARSPPGCGRCRPGGRRTPPSRRPCAAHAGRRGRPPGRPAASRSRMASSPPRLGSTPKPALRKRRVTSRSSHSGRIGRRTKWKRPLASGKLASPALVETSKLPKWPVRMSTPLPCACAASSASRLSTRTIASLRARDSHGNQRNSHSSRPRWP